MVDLHNFKETVMSVDLQDETGKLRKVLGLRWDMEKTEICVDIKLNYGEKKMGAYIEEDAPVKPVHGKWKLLMRKLTLKGNAEGWESVLDSEEEDKFRSSFCG
jgi:hypothetical protein